MNTFLLMIIAVELVMILAAIVNVLDKILKELRK